MWEAERARLAHLFFFFQAEDGIRDLTVTGVQTCALPISLGPSRTPATMNPGRAGSLIRWNTRMTSRETAKMIARSLRTWYSLMAGRRMLLPPAPLGVAGAQGTPPAWRPQWQSGARGARAW